jgi:ATP-dependent exoDNAse (exonuclease V) beta subunit
LREFCEKIDFLNENVEDLQVRIEDLEGICKILDDYDEIYGDYQLSARITGLLKFLGVQAVQEYKYHSFRRHDPNEDSVQLMTVHKSKGLEFHTVFLPRLNKREFPVSAMGGRQYYHVLGGTFADNKAKYASDIEDERKLFYVAVTRAEHNLYLSYTLENQPISEFVSNAAESEALQINREDLRYQPPRATKAETLCEPSMSDEQWQEREQEYAEKEAYWAAVKHAKELLHEHYYIANHFCKGIIGEYSEVCKRGPDAILAKAKELGLA